MAKKTLIYKWLFPGTLFFGLTCILFWNLGDTYLTNWDEAWYADMARNLVQNGDPLTFIWNQQPFFDKPPLYIWMEALTFKLLGISEFAARMPSAVSGIGVAVILYLLARLYIDKQVALFLLMVLGSTVGFLYRARTGNLDTFLAFWLLFSIFAFYKGYIGKSILWFILMGLSTGFAFLTKGLIAFAFPILATVYLLFVKKNYLVRIILFYTFIPAMLISMSWIYISYIVNGGVFIKYFFLNQTEKVGIGISFWKHFSLDYFWFLKSGLKIWFIPFILVFPYIFYRWKNDERILLLIYFLLIVGILSFSENKSNWFIVPLYPIIALVIADGVYAATKRFTRGKLQIVFIALVFLVACFQNIFYKNDYIVPDIAGDEAKVALAAKDRTLKSDILYLTNYYYPTTVYYSERIVYAVYSDHPKNNSWWIKPKEEWVTILQQDRVYIITSNEEMDSLNKYFSSYSFEILYQSGHKLLLKKV